jgi:adenosylcobinamide kinase / adenosylcobinamide-phosphate guanylyltransferase
MLTLILGGARSGKSCFAQSLCSTSSKVVYIATARIEDEEMRARVNRHRLERPANWMTLEEPLAIGNAVRRNVPGYDFVLLDCLTLWLSNLAWERRTEAAETLEQAVSDELSQLTSLSVVTQLIVVSNEVGCGIVPESPVCRHFRDLQGWANQQIAGQAQIVYQMIAGIPVVVKAPVKGGM